VNAPATTTALGDLEPDALLVERIAALGDKSALAKLDARHGMTLYAIAYRILFDPIAADLAVAAVLREVWRRAASFNPRRSSAARWLTELAGQAAGRLSPLADLVPSGSPKQRASASHRADEAARSPMARPCP